jgi:hypothetical protein
MKTERITILASPDFKAFLGAEAQREGISVAELVRTRCERRPSEEEAMLTLLTAELNSAVGEAKRAMKAGLDEAQTVLNELRRRRHGEPAALAASKRAQRSAPSAATQP